MRFAPSPTGPLHIGGVRTALYNYLFAKQHNGKFILRIEDTDQARYVQNAEEYIVESLKWSGISPDEGFSVGGEFGPYKQSERKGMYQSYAETLIENGWAYYAFDTPEELDAMRERLKKQGNPSPQYNSVVRQYMQNSLALSEDVVKEKLAAGEPHVIRFKMPAKREVKFNDMIRGWVNFDSAQLDDKVLMKTDGMPTYHLANIVDDHTMEISHVIRGEEWLSSAPLHVLLYEAFGWEAPTFAHLPLILKPEGHGKLSKRDGDKLGFPVFPLEWKDPTSGEVSSGYRERGFLSSSFINYMAFLGWSPGTDEEVFNLQELVEKFDISRVNKAGARFDFEKAKWYNHQYLMKTATSELMEMVKPHLSKSGYSVSDEFLYEVIESLKDRISFIEELPTEGIYYFSDTFSYDEKMIGKKWNSEAKAFYDVVATKLADLTDFNEATIEEVVKGEMKEAGQKPGAVLPVFRLMLCGTLAGPPIFKVAEILGQDKVLARMQQFISKFSI